jgi:hypothetical protein
MPYVIETRHTHYHPAFGREVPHVEHTTVATLADSNERNAIDIVTDMLVAKTPAGPPYWSDAVQNQIEALSEKTGGTIGPLPDGTVIEVRPDNTHNV